MRRILLILLALLFVLVIAVGAFGWYQVRLAWPKTDGELALPGLEESVTVIRDARGIPHIYASNPHDLFMAQGYVQAQDRFWQMEFWRRIGAGRLSELFGKSSLDQDRFLRTIGVRRSAELSWELLSPDAQAILEAYAQGVNAYINQNAGRLPLEFRVLGLTGVQAAPEPWTPIHTLTWPTMMAFQLGGNYRNELLRAELLARYGEAWMRALTEYDYPSAYPLILPKGVTWQNVDTNIMASAQLEAIFGSGPGVGSNNWVVSGSRTTTGMPLLANDPHLEPQLPSIWYENGLHCQPVGPGCPYDVVGFSFASAPGVVLGHNARIAWGATNAYPDVQDFYIERINPANPNQYEVNGQWVDMEITREEIQVAGEEEPVSLTIRRTRHGPILNDVAYGTESRWAYGWQPLALRWTALEGNRIAESILLLNRAQNWDDFRAALSLWDAPSQNFVFADVDGNIGYQMPARIPIRPAGANGLTPVPGWTDAYEWQDFVPFDDLPKSFNPAQGYIVTANNLVVDYADYPWLTRHEGSQGLRAERIVEMIEAKPKLSAEDLAAIHGDNANVMARELIPLLRDLPLDRPEVAAARDRLLTWDVQQAMESRDAVFFEAFWYNLTSAIFADELDDMAPRDYGLMHYVLADAAGPWWDDIRTAGAETRTDILTQALNDGYDLAVEKAGDNPEQWRWGALHTITFRNLTLGKSGIGPIESIFNRGPYETAGGSEIVNATAWSTDPETLFQVRWVPSMRMIVDLGDLNRSLTTNTAGQSGHPYHKHYDDQVDQWRMIEYGPMYFDRAQLEAQAEGVLTLQP